MRSASTFRIVFVTAPDLNQARALADRLLRERCVACANLVPGLESRYWWKGKLESAREILLILKTTRAKLRQVESVIREIHPYDTPEILSIESGEGSAKYLDWLSASVRGKP
ncbi:MAG: divalent-cation tolerance protein CutA [Verrucomicrobia bacterium]|nr:divalent-cation tolerance protein CutA [Verrucomicrobiota bacterium]